MPKFIVIVMFCLGPVSILPAFAGENDVFLKGVVEKAAQERRNLIDRAIVFLKDNKNEENERCHAATLLGELRATEAIEVLLENIDILAKDSFGEAPQYCEHYVCWIALAKIGPITLRPSLKVLAVGNYTSQSLFVSMEIVEKNKAVLEALIAEFPEKEQSVIKKSLNPYWKNWGRNFTSTETYLNQYIIKSKETYPKNEPAKTQSIPTPTAKTKTVPQKTDAPSQDNK